MKKLYTLFNVYRHKKNISNNIISMNSHGLASVLSSVGPILGVVLPLYLFFNLELVENQKLIALYSILIFTIGIIIYFIIYYYVILKRHKILEKKDLKFVLMFEGISMLIILYIIGTLFILNL